MLAITLNMLTITLNSVYITRYYPESIMYFPKITLNSLHIFLKMYTATCFSENESH